MHAAGKTHPPGVGAVPEVSRASVRVLIGHEDAGVYRADDPVDGWRPLSPLGHRRARRLVDHLREVPIDQVLSGPSLRCRQTVVPLAEDRGLDIEPVHPLATGVDLAVLAEYVVDPSTENAALCTDPLTIARLLDHLGRTAGSDIAVIPFGPAVVLSVRSAAVPRSAGR